LECETAILGMRRDAGESRHGVEERPGVLEVMVVCQALGGRCSGQTPHKHWSRTSRSYIGAVNKRRGDTDSVDRHESIMQAVLRLLGRHGISGVSMRAVADDAGVSLGLVNYHYTDKAGLIAAALRRIGEQDLALLSDPESTDPADALRTVIRRIARSEYLTTEYLSLRLQLWSLAQGN